MGLFKLTVKSLHTERPIPEMFPAHTHETCEIFYFLSGHASFCVEGNVYPLSAGDLIITRGMETHHLMLHDDSPYSRINIHFTPNEEFDEELKERLLSMFYERNLGMRNYFPASMFFGCNWHFYLKEMCATKDSVKQQIFLLNVLLELSEKFYDSEFYSDEERGTDLNNIIHYIDENFAKMLTLEELSNHFFISKSQLNRRFKKKLGVTVKSYLQTKRLMHANELIKKGERPTYIYEKCGFSDYNTFYKAFVRRYGYPPSAKERDLVIKGE